MIREAIILSGGLGTRLREAVPELPKSMAPVAGVPFIKYVIDHLAAGGVERFVFSLGYKHEVIEDFVLIGFQHIDAAFVVEDEPLGTGGAIARAARECKSENVIIANGDTLFKINTKQLGDFHLKYNAECTLTLKPMRNLDRYGVVLLNKDCYVQSFLEKAYYDEGLINGGVYALNLPSFLSVDFPEKFSFEKEYLEKYYPSRKMMGLVQDNYFIDIGIPEDYNRASLELAGSK
jgi:D-glycero-alpha-D-manno-heptose 1-phosphate guanylyltransferase